MKHIKMIYIKHISSVIITEQTHRGNEFGLGMPPFDGTDTFISKSGFRLTSAEAPEASTVSICNKFYVRGADPRFDMVAVLLPLNKDYLLDLIKAVKEYNEYFADKPAKADAPDQEVIIIE